jgi:PleD family two-component response regulator
MAFTLCTQIKSSSNPKISHITVVIIPAFDGEAERLGAIRVGAEDMIIKPYNSMIL